MLYPNKVNDISKESLKEMFKQNPIILHILKSIRNCFENNPISNIIIHVIQNDV